jgi:hypothetical protein
MNLPVNNEKITQIMKTLSLLFGGAIPLKPEQHRQKVGITFS